MTTQSKAAVDQDLILAARQGLIPVSKQTWLGGFGNMLRKELGQWWGTRTWIVQTLIWVAILNGISTIVALTEAFAPGEKLQEVVQTFMPMSVAVVALATVISVQGAIVGEKQLGTAAWVMSKPASRSAFILTKLIAYAVGFWATALVIPSLIFMLVTLPLIPASLSLTAFLAGMGVAALSQLFYLALTLMLGTCTNSRGPIAGTGIAIVLTGMLLKGFIPMAVMVFTPWPLPDVAGGLALQASLPEVWIVPVIATAIWIVLMTAIALWRFGREEF